MPTTVTLVQLTDSPDALLRVVSVFHRRQWSPLAVRTRRLSGGMLEVAARLDVGDPYRVSVHLRNLVGARAVMAECCPNAVPDDVALDALCARQPAVRRLSIAGRRAAI